MTRAVGIGVFALCSVAAAASGWYISACLRAPSSPPSSPPLKRSRTGTGTGQPQAVGDLVARFLDRKGLGARVEAATVIPEWGERVGPQIAAVTQPQRLSGDGTLVVSVATSAWMMELNLMKGELMRYVNAGRGEGKVRQIVFVMSGDPLPPLPPAEGGTPRRD